MNTEVSKNNVILAQQWSMNIVCPWTLAQQIRQVGFLFTSVQEIYAVKTVFKVFSSLLFVAEHYNAQYMCPVLA